MPGPGACGAFNAMHLQEGTPCTCTDGQRVAVTRARQLLPHPGWLPWGTGGCGATQPLVLCGSAAGGGGHERGTPPPLPASPLSPTAGILAQPDEMDKHNLLPVKKGGEASCKD